MHDDRKPSMYFEFETKIRNYYAGELERHRPNEKLLTTEAGYASSPLRADMRTIGVDNTVAEWEFKIRADYSALGQILSYVAIARHEAGISVSVRGVLAAFEFTDDILLANQLLNLGLEFVKIPAWMRRAGAIPDGMAVTPSISIPTICS